LGHVKPVAGVGVPGQRDAAVPGDDQSQAGQPEVGAFLLALPRRATGALPFLVAVNVAKLVMSSATIRTAISRLISPSYSRVTACIASLKYR
jgi:hypothetical protein